MLVTAHDGTALAGGSEFAAAADSRADGGGSERMCIVTRERRPPDEMIRFVLGPDATVVPDLKNKLPGRGVWVSLDAKRVEEAVRRQAFSRGLKANAKAAATLPADVDALIERDCLQSLSLANKAGAVVSGFTKVEAAIADGHVAALLHARDAGPDGVRKLQQAVRRKLGPDGLPQIHLFASRQLDLALGRANVVHAALKAEPASRAFLARCRRLAAYRGLSLADEPQETGFSPEAGSGAGKVEGP